MLVPRLAYLTAGSGRHREPLVAFELALREAGIAAQNLVAVSSILPPQCSLVDRSAGEAHLKPGQILHVVMSRHESDHAGEEVGAAIGLAVPRDPQIHGFIAEVHTNGDANDQIRAQAEDLAATMLASTLGVEPDDHLPRAQRAAHLRESDLIEQTDSISARATVQDDGRTVCVVAACVLILDWMIS